MAKIILVCGKLCSGKTTYSKKLCENINAVLLSCDELMLTLFPEDLGELFGMFSRRSQEYLLKLSADIAVTGRSVVLDWGFWTKEARDKAKEYYASIGIGCELHYLDVSDDARKAYIEKRNCEVRNGKVSAYFVDEGLEKKFLDMFERPENSEIDILINDLTQVKE